VRVMTGARPKSQPNLSGFSPGDLMPVTPVFLGTRLGSTDKSPTRSYATSTTKYDF
jgi:hypothetical protein